MMKNNYFTSITMLAVFLLIFSTAHSQTTTYKPTKVLEVTHMDQSIPLRDVQDFNKKKTIVEAKEINNKFDFRENPNNDPKWSGTDPVVQDNTVPSKASSAIDLVQVIDGVNNDENQTVNGTKVAPPDTQGDVGLNHYLQMTNKLTKIYDKDGTLSLGPVPNSYFWAGFEEGGIDFGSFNHGDPIVLYDEYEDRWIVSHFVTGPYYMLIAISETGDPTGSWYRYAIPYPNFPDYPKLGIWNDGVYITTNDFAAGSFVGASLVGFPKVGFYDGTGGSYFQFFMDYFSYPDYGSWLPADADGPTPPSSSTHYSLSRSYGVANTMHMLTTVPDWDNLANTTFTFTDILVDPYFTSNTVYSQPNGQSLASLGDRLMYRLQYRNFGGHQVLVANHSVQNTITEPFGIRWYEMRAPSASTSWSIYQQGTFQPADGEHRWMGSIAMNGNGDIALGYSLTSFLTHPSILFTGQSAINSGTGVMDLPETTIHTGTESQAGTSRWGDYSMMSVDPSDDESFWYTQEHGAPGSSFNWATKIAEFKLNAATDPTTIAVTPPSFTFIVAPDETDNDLLHIANTSASGASDLVWSIKFANVVAPGAYAIGEILNDNSQLLKYHERFYDKTDVGDVKEHKVSSHQGTEENNPPGPIIMAAGGPDAFGYEFIDSDEPGGPVFNWNDITGTGTSIALSDDSFQEILLSFNFSFYGVDHDRVKVSSNGYLTFGSNGTDFSNDPIPYTNDPNDIICPFWDDLNPSTGGTVHYLATATQFVVQYTDVPRFGDNSVSYTFQVILNSDGSILYQYNDMVGNYSETIGIEDATGTDGLQVSHNSGSYAYNGLAVLIISPPPACQWLSVFSESGTLATGENEDVTVSVDATGLVDGTYECEINISSNALNASLITVPVTLIVQTNTPPIAVCQDVEIAADANCEAIVFAEDVDDGSYDPDGDPITLSLAPAGPYPLGETSVVLTVTDDKGAESECPATVTVVDETEPEIIASTTPITLWPPNHKYTTINMSQILVSVSENCSNLSNADVYISKVSSDEEEDAKGGGDGKTSDDIVIASDCQSVEVRKERSGNGNGRVYTIYLAVVDAGGNVGNAMSYIHVPHNSGGVAIDDGMAYEEQSNCGGFKSSLISNNNDIRLNNYPNPFTDHTTISFVLHESDRTTLKVYNTFGKEVATLYDGIAEAGQQYTLDFTSENLQEGIYIYQLQSGNKVSVMKKMILMK